MKAILARVAVSLAILVCAAICGAIIYGGIWLHKIESFPTPVVPNPKLPADNAFDTFNAASNSLVDTEKIEQASDSPSGKPASLAEKEALVRENSRALAKIEPGLSNPYLNPPLRSFEQTLPYYRKFRDLARLLCFRAQVDAAQGRWQQAAESSMDAIQMGAMIPHGSAMIGDLVGEACEAVGRRAFFPCIDHLSADEARSDIARLQDIRSEEVSLPEVLRQEEWTGQAGLAELARKNVGFRTNPIASVLLHSGQYDYTQYMDRLIRNARLPYAARPAQPPIPHDVFVPLVALAYPPAAVKYAENETRNDLLLVVLALRAYKLEHGSYPDALDQLTPAYLNPIPSDPFAVNAPLKYRRAGASYVLYSVGPDGKDDGGRPIINTSSYYSVRLKKTVAGKPNSNVEQDSKGDIVAGVSGF